MSYPYTDVDTSTIDLPSTAPLAVVVVCHAPYLSKLPACLASIDRQRCAAQKILVLDGCSHTAPEGWTVLNGAFGSPNPARNMGWRSAAANGACWVVFWDADNLMGAGYLRAIAKRVGKVSHQTGILSPDVVRVGELGPRGHVRQPERRTYWTGRERSLTDSASAWKVEALHQTGGFGVGGEMLDDFTHALRMTSLGWQVESLNTPVVLADHEANRSANASRGEGDLWRNRSFHIVTLLAGRDAVLRRWSEAAHSLELPPNTHFTLVDDSNCLRFARDVQDEAESLLRMPEVRSARVLKAPLKSGPVEGWLDIHRRVAMLYNLALAGQSHDMTLMWEDDVIPWGTDALRRLHEGFLPFTSLAGAGAVYPGRSNPQAAVASLEQARWARMPLLSTLREWQATEARHRVGMIGGGFTLWAGHFLSQALPLQAAPEAKLGWDGYLCRELNQQGRALELDLRVWADHLTTL